MKKALFQLLILVFVLASIIACRKSEEVKNVPACINAKILQIKTEPIRNPPAQVWEWDADGARYYYISSDCCDQFNILYDKKCREVCAPDGGFSGSGDGNCPAFRSVEKKLLWEDER